MKKLEIKENFAFIYLNKNIYSKKAIFNSLETYSDFFHSSFTELGKYFIVKIQRKTTDYTTKKLAKEYANYLISSMKN